MPNATSIHGHDVIDLILNANPPFTRPALQCAAEKRFGKDARFHTCHPGEMTFDELLAFLLSRGKVIQQGEHLLVQLSKVCNHGDEDHDHEH